MGKSVWVIDTPDTCENCDFLWWCHRYEEAVIMDTKPDWCPLKQLPEKLEGNDFIYYQWGDYEDGWNHCIDCLID